MNLNRMRNIVLRFDMRAAPWAPDAAGSRYRVAIDMARWADRRQIDVVGLSEHHNTGDGFLSAPLQLAGMMSAVTEPVPDVNGNTVNGSLTWFQPITENPALNSTEVWELYNATGDAHPVHVHLVHFEVPNAIARVARLEGLRPAISRPVRRGAGLHGGLRL